MLLSLSNSSFLLAVGNVGETANGVTGGVGKGKHFLFSILLILFLDFIVSIEEFVYSTALWSVFATYGNAS